MKYDIVSKNLMKKGAAALLSHIFHVPVGEAELLEEEPQETVSIRTTDFPVRVVHTNAKEEQIYIVEFQTEWEQEKPLTLAEYYIRYQKKYPKKRIVPCMVVFLEKEGIHNWFRIKFLLFRFRLVKLWEVDPSILFENAPELLPIVAFMKDGEQFVMKAENHIYSMKIPRVDKADLLSSLTVLTALKNKELAKEILNKRREVMQESPIYQMIVDEGIEIGIKNTRSEIALALLNKGDDVEDVAIVTGLDKPALLRLLKGVDS